MGKYSVLCLKFDKFNNIYKLFACLKDFAKIVVHLKYNSSGVMIA